MALQGEFRVLRVWKNKPTEVESTALSLAGREAEAHVIYIEANRVWIDAWTAVRGYSAKHRTQLEPTRVGDQVVRQLTLDPELTAIASRENHARIDKDNKLDAWSRLKEELDRLNGKETVHVAGVKV